MSVLQNIENRSNKYFHREDFLKDRSNTYVKWWLEITRNYSIALSMIRIREPQANTFAAEVMRKAMRFQMSEVVLPLALKLLRYHTFQGNWSQTKVYEGIVKKYRTIVNAEQVAEIYLASVNKDFIKKIHSVKLVKKIEGILMELESFEVSSYQFQVFYYELKYKMYQLQGDNQNVLKTCNEAYHIMNEKRFRVAHQINVLFIAPTIPILIQQNEFEKAEQAIKRCYGLLKKRNNNWYAIHSFDVILNFRNGDFEKVKALLRKVNTYPTELVRERYELFHAYEQFMNEGKIKVSKFVNDVHEYSKDKDGYNIAVLIAELLHLLKNKKFDAYINKVEATDKYICRTLKTRKVTRAKVFLKIMLLLPKSNFHHVLFTAKSKVLFKQLKSIDNDGNIEIELIQYEMLFDRVMGFLR